MVAGDDKFDHTLAAHFKKGPIQCVFVDEVPARIAEQLAAVDSHPASALPDAKLHVQLPLAGGVPRWKPHLLRTPRRDTHLAIVLAQFVRQFAERRRQDRPKPENLGQRILNVIQCGDDLLRIDALPAKSIPAIALKTAAAMSTTSAMNFLGDEQSRKSAWELFSAIRRSGTPTWLAPGVLDTPTYRPINMTSRIWARPPSGAASRVMTITRSVFVSSVQVLPPALVFTVS